MSRGHLAILKSAYNMARKKKRSQDKEGCVIRYGEGATRQGAMRQVWQAGAQLKDVSSLSSPEGLQDCRGTWP